MTLALDAKQRGVTPPSERTCARYGMDVDGWLALAAAQNWVCPICLRKKRTYNIDHEHVPGWGKMPPEQRRRYVRGLLCVHCNWKVVHSRLSAVQAQRIAAYLAAYEERRDA